MTSVSTARILADKALQVTCGQQCVDWAITMLEEGKDGETLKMLAAQLPPYNHFQLASLRDRALSEQGISNLDGEVAVSTFVVEQLRIALAGEADLIETLGAVKDLCIARNYAKELYDFYLLYWAYCDLRDYRNQYYWPDATRENIDALIRQRAEDFVRKFSGSV